MGHIVHHNRATWQLSGEQKTKKAGHCFIVANFSCTHTWQQILHLFFTFTSTLPMSSMANTVTSTLPTTAINACDTFCIALD